MTSIATPLVPICRTLDAINTFVGEKTAWLTILMVFIQFIVVLLRYIFGFGSVFLQESILYLHATVFLCGAGYTLMLDAHVRVDAFYHQSRSTHKAWVNLLGCLLFLFPFLYTLFIYAWPYVSASWQVLEGSRETTGIPAVFALKTLILVYCVLLTLQGMSLSLKSLLQLTGATYDA